MADGLRLAGLPQ